MNSKLFGLKIDEAGPHASDRTIQVPFLPHRRVTVREALWAIAIGLWPVIIHKIFAAGARERRRAKLAAQTPSPLSD